MNTGDQASPSRDNCSPVTPTPLASSSPAPATCHKRKLQCMEINCGSIRSTEHAAIFAVLVNQYKADIIFGCESQLNSDYPTSSAFPPGYTIHRADRLDRDGGGNFIAVIASIPSYVIEDLPVDPDDESLWVSVRTTRSKEIFLCAFYKPPSAPTSRIDLLSQVVHKVYDKNKKKHPNIVIAGEVTNPHPPLMNRLLDLIDNHALKQHVAEPTRPASMKTLDLVLTSAPTLFSNVRVQPGMSDHDLVNFCINANSRRVCKPTHKVYLFNRMDLPGLKKHMAEVATNFKSTNPESKSTEENWLFFKEEIINPINIYVPSRMTKRKPDLPWMTVTIKRQLRKRERLLQRTKRSGSKTSTAWETHKKQRRLTGTLIRTT